MWLYPVTRKFGGRWSIYCGQFLSLLCAANAFGSSVALIFIMVGVQDIKFAVHAHPTLSEVLDELFKSAKVQSIQFKILTLKYQILLCYCIGKRDGSTCFQCSVLNGIQNQPVLKPVQAMMSKEVRKIGI